MSEKEYEKYIRFYLDAHNNRQNTKKSEPRGHKKMALMVSHIKNFSGDSGYLFSSPLCVPLRLTSACNFRCVHCMYNGEEYSSENDLSTEQVLNLADELINAGVAFIQLTGGEIFLRPDIMDIVRKFKENNISVTLLTNGSLLTDDIINEIAELFNPYTDAIQISLDAANAETFKKIRRSDKFDKINDNIKKLTSKGVVVDNVCTVNNINKNEVVDIYKLAENLGTSHLIFSKMRCYNNSHLYLECSDNDLFKIYYDLIQHESDNGPEISAGFWHPIELLNIAEVRKIMEEPQYRLFFEKQDKKALKIDCQNHQTLAVDSDGKVSLCLEAFCYNIEPLGNYKDNSFEEIWKRRWDNVLYQPRNREKTQCNNCNYNTFCKGGCKVIAYSNSGSTNSPAISSCIACH